MEHIGEVLGLVAECVVLLQSLGARQFGKAESDDGAERRECPLRTWPKVGEELPVKLGE
jgi:hypothetical protein